MEKKTRRRSMRLLTQTSEKEDNDDEHDEVINNFEETYGSIWKDFSPGYVASRRKSTTGRRSGIFKTLSVPLLQHDVETTDYIPTISSPELARGPDNMSANNSLNLKVNTSATTPDYTMQGKEESTSSYSLNASIMNVETPEISAGTSIVENASTPGRTGYVEIDRSEIEFNSPDYPEGMLIGRNSNDFDACQSPLQLNLAVTFTPENTPCMKEDNESIPYSPSQPVYSTPSLELQKFTSDMPYSPTQPVFENKETESPFSETVPNVIESYQAVLDVETNTKSVCKDSESGNAEQKQLSVQKQSCKKFKDKQNIENSVERNDREKKETSRFFSICRSLATKIANVVRKTPENDTEKQSGNLENTIQEYLPISDEPVPTDESNVTSLDVNCETRLEFHQDSENESDNNENRILEKERTELSVVVKEDLTKERKVEGIQTYNNGCNESGFNSHQLTDIHEKTLNLPTEDINFKTNETSSELERNLAIESGVLSSTEGNTDIETVKLDNLLHSETSETANGNGEILRDEICKDFDETNTGNVHVGSANVQSPHANLNLKQDDSNIVTDVKEAEDMVMPLIEISSRKRGRPRRKSADPKILVELASHIELNTESKEQEDNKKASIIEEEKPKKKRGRPLRRKSADPVMISQVGEEFSKAVRNETNILINHINSADFDQIQDFLSMDEEQTRPPKKEKGRRKSANSLTLLGDVSDLLKDVDSGIPARRNTRLRRRSIEIYQAGENYQNSQIESFSPNSTDENNSPNVQENTSDMKIKPVRKRKVKEENIEDIYRNKNYKRPDDRIWETIYENPDMSKNPDQLLSKKRFRRSIAFETLLPAKIKKRTKKAADMGWDTKRRKKMKLPDETVIDKLSELDNMFKC